MSIKLDNKNINVVSLKKSLISYDRVFLGFDRFSWQKVESFACYVHPFYFDDNFKGLYRFPAVFYNYSYDRDLNLYNVYLNLSTKQRFKVLGSMFLKFNRKKSFTYFFFKKETAYIFWSSLGKKAKVHSNLNDDYFGFTSYDYLRSNFLSADFNSLFRIYLRSKRNRFHRALRTSDFEVDNFISTYNSNWSNLNKIALPMLEYNFINNDSFSSLFISAYDVSPKVFFTEKFFRFFYKKSIIENFWLSNITNFFESFKNFDIDFSYYLHKYGYFISDICLSRFTFYKSIKHVIALLSLPFFRNLLINYSAVRFIYSYIFFMSKIANLNKHSVVFDSSSIVWRIYFLLPFFSSAYPLFLSNKFSSSYINAFTINKSFSSFVLKPCIFLIFKPMSYRSRVGRIKGIFKTARFWFSDTGSKIYSNRVRRDIDLDMKLPLFEKFSLKRFFRKYNDFFFKKVKFFSASTFKFLFIILKKNFLTKNSNYLKILSNFLFRYFFNTRRLFNNSSYLKQLFKFMPYKTINKKSSNILNNLNHFESNVKSKVKNSLVALSNFNHQMKRFSKRFAHYKFNKKYVAKFIEANAIEVRKYCAAIRGIISYTLKNIGKSHSTFINNIYNKYFFKKRKKFYFKIRRFILQEIRYFFGYRFALNTWKRKNRKKKKHRINHVTRC